MTFHLILFLRSESAWVSKSINFLKVCFVLYPSADNSISTTLLASFVHVMVDLHNTFCQTIMILLLPYWDHFKHNICTYKTVFILSSVGCWSVLPTSCNIICKQVYLRL